MTMYSNKLAVAIKTAGKVLREQGDKVFLPFGSEYSIFVKNLNSVRALVRISLDGVSVTDGEDLVVQANSEIDLERFLKKDNMNEGHRFKFIERSGKIEAHRGIGVEDGLLRVEFQFEKVTPAPVYVPHVHYDVWGGYPWRGYPPYRPYYWYGSPACGSGYYNSNSLMNSNVGISNTLGDAGSAAVNTVFTSTATGGTLNAAANVGVGQNSAQASFSAPASGVLRSRSLKSAVAEAPVNDAGITVEGSISNQQFTTASWFAVEDEKHVVVLKLVGDTGQGLVEKPVTVQKKQTCPTCGTRNRGSNKCCRECGTSLEIVGSSVARRKVVGVRG